MRKSVEAELLPKGFKVERDDPHGFGRKWESVEYKRGNDRVIMFEHMRYMVPKYESPYSVEGDDVDGWVSFQVVLDRTLPPAQKRAPVRN